jgi:DNA-directed RNA polymerase subunit RPC12/RpoP
MESMGKKSIQLGNMKNFQGSIYNAFQGYLEVNTYQCKNCGKIEFFKEKCNEEDDETINVMCPRCNGIHELGLAACPYCKLEYKGDDVPILIDSTNAMNDNLPD